MKTVYQPSQSVSAPSAFLAAFYLSLLLTLAATDASAGERSSEEIYRAAIADLAGDGLMTDALNLLQKELGKPPVAEVRYDSGTDRMYWTGPKTGKTVSMSRERFMKEIYASFSLQDSF
jgi:hypothetical protein